MDFKVQGMTCAHCADRITRAIKRDGRESSEKQPFARNLMT